MKIQSVSTTTARVIVAGTPGILAGNVSGAKCNKKKYESLAQEAAGKIPEGLTAEAAEKVFVAEFNALTAPFHTGSFGISSYSLPILREVKRQAAENSAVKPATIARKVG